MGARQWKPPLSKMLWYPAPGARSIPEGWMMPSDNSFTVPYLLQNSYMIPAPGGVSPVHLTDSVSKPSYIEGADMVYI